MIQSAINGVAAEGIEMTFDSVEEAQCGVEVLHKLQLAESLSNSVGALGVLEGGGLDL